MSSAERKCPGSGNCLRPAYQPGHCSGAHVQAGRVKPSDVFTHRLPLEEASKGYHTFAQKRDGCIKVALFPNHTLH